MVRAIIFDCFGVLVTDVLEGIVAPMRTAEPEKYEQILDSVKAANKGLISRETSRATIAGALGITTDEYAALLRDGELKNEALLAYILELRKQYKVAMLSNVGASSLLLRFSQEDQDKYFDVVVASGVIGYAKPEAEAYGITADKLGVRHDECVMIDDREDYCDGARGVGMQAILYTSLPELQAQLAVIGVQIV